MSAYGVGCDTELWHFIDRDLVSGTLSSVELLVSASSDESQSIIVVT